MLYLLLPTVSSVPKPQGHQRKRCGLMTCSLYWFLWSASKCVQKLLCELTVAFLWDDKNICGCCRSIWKIRQNLHSFAVTSAAQEEMETCFERCSGQVIALDSFRLSILKDQFELRALFQYIRASVFGQQDLQKCSSTKKCKWIIAT